MTERPPRGGYVCVFCGSSPGAHHAYVDVARELGRALVDAGLGLVYGAGGSGVMNAVADSVLAAGGEVIGVIPHSLMDREWGRRDLSDLHLVDTMHERKALMNELSLGFITLPGGLGTYEELFEVLTWRQLQLHDKPVVVLDIEGYFQPLRELLRHGVTEQFVTSSATELLDIVSTPAEAVARFV